MDSNLLTTSNEDLLESLLSNRLDNTKDAFLDRYCEEFQYFLNFFQTALNAVNVFQYLEADSKVLLQKLVKNIEKLSVNKKINLLQLQKRLSKVKINLDKLITEGEENNLDNINTYCFYYSRSRSKNVAFSKIVSLNVLTKRETTICKGNRFKNASISCRINQDLVLIYIETKKEGPVLININKEIAVPELRKIQVASSKFDHYRSAFVMMENDEIGFFASEERKCEAFDFTAKKWKDLSDFPFHSKDPTGVFFNEKVLIVDYLSNKITSYSQSENLFESVDTKGLKENTQKLIFAANGELFVYSDKTLLKYEDGNFVLKNSVKMKKYEKIIAFPIIYKSKVYFLTNHRKVISLKV